MADNLRRRLFIALLLSIAVHAVLVSQARRVGFEMPDVTETVTLRHSNITKFKAPPPPTPAPTPTPLWSHLDRSMLKKVRLTPADEQIVVLAAKQGNGAPSRAPHILRVEITPGVVHQRSVMHIRVLAWGGGIQGVYLRFVIWEVGVPPAGAFRLPASDRDYPGHRYVLFERDYTVPAIPAIYRGRTYQAEVIATGRAGIASGAFVPIRVL
ncbi:MAG TPA: hypothetical protein VFN37_08700 [Candidatus Baltobacteraceae bacterium]|nr:hypothetical protein [Candidatus Baltobacteraceae bacterium]